jgi:hypothetical protein
LVPSCYLTSGCWRGWKSGAAAGSNPSSRPAYHHAVRMAPWLRGHTMRMLRCAFRAHHGCNRCCCHRCFGHSCCHSSHGHRNHRCCSYRGYSRHCCDHHRWPCAPVGTTGSGLAACEKPYAYVSTIDDSVWKFVIEALEDSRTLRRVLRQAQDELAKEHGYIYDRLIVPIVQTGTIKLSRLSFSALR